MRWYVPAVAGAFFFALLPNLTGMTHTSASASSQKQSQASGKQPRAQGSSSPQPIRRQSSGEKRPPRNRVDSILGNVQAGRDGWTTESYDEEIKVQLSLVKELLLKSPLDRNELLKRISPEFKGTLLKPRGEPVVLREQFPAVSRYAAAAEPVLTAQQFPGEMDRWLAEFEEVGSVELKTTGITLISADPPEVQLPIRYNINGRARNNEVLQLSGYWDTRWKKDPQRGWLWTGLTIQDGWQSRAPRPLFTEISSCALPQGPALGQLLRGSDWWTANVMRLSRCTFTDTTVLR